MSDYPVLDNLPINKWKVPALREELKKRNLMTKGLKDDLVKRLNNAIRKERGEPEVEESTEINPDVLERIDESMGHPQNEVTKGSDCYTDPANATKVLDGVATGDTDDVSGERKDLEASVGRTSVINKIMSTDQYVEVKIDEKHKTIDSSQNNDVVDEVSGVRYVAIQSSSTAQVIEDVKISSSEGVVEDNLRRQENTVEVTPVTSKDALGNNSIKLDNEGLKLSGIDAEYDKSNPDTQVHVGETDDDKSSEVKFSMKKANADQVSVAVTKVVHGLESNPSNNSEQKEVQFEKASTLGDVIDPSLSPKKVEVSAEDKHCIAASSDGKVVSKISEAVDGQNMEKINLDQSSADDSMEEDVVETKHVDFGHISKKENDKTEEPTTGMTEEPKVQRNGSSDAMQQDIPSKKVESPQQTKDRPPDLSEKRKFQDEVGDGRTELPKKQRRWNTEILSTAEPQNSSIALSGNLVQTNLVKPIFGRTDSTVSEDAPKERLVPKSSKTATNSLKIENFLRPFTLKAVQELLARTGEVRSFWMDQIKTHCYVTYSSVEEAIETRNAVYNLQWPPKGGRLLVADFVDPQLVQAKIDGREPATPVTNRSPAVPPASSSAQAPPARQQGRKQQVESEHPLTRQPPSASPTAPATKEILAPPVAVKHDPPPPVAVKNDPPPMTLDDLFRKTKAAPRIYYLPLTDEEVAKKLGSRGDAKN